MHGDVFGAEMTWSAQQPLAAGHRLVLVNRRGFGASPDVDGEDFAVDAADVVEVLGSGAHLVGHSYGGVVALLAAAARPELVRSLAVFEPPAFALVADRADVQQLRRTIEELLASDPTPEEFLNRFIRAVGGDPARLPTPLPPPLVKAARCRCTAASPGRPRCPSTCSPGRPSPSSSCRAVTAPRSTPSATSSSRNPARAARHRRRWAQHPHPRRAGQRRADGPVAAVERRLNRRRPATHVR